MNQNDMWLSRLNNYQRRALIAGGAGLVLTFIGVFFNATQFFQSYLFGFIFWIQVALGGLILVMLHHLAGGHWSLVIRRPMEAAMMTLPLMALLFIPLLFGLPFLYEWARPEAVAQDEILQHKAPYLNVPFFIIRALIYFVVWVGLAYFFYRRSIKQDKMANYRVAYLAKLVSGPGIGLLALTVTFASFDWMMSLEPHWFSTIYGVMFAVGMLTAGFAFATLVLAWLVDYPPLSEAVTYKHFNDLGNFLLASVMLWAYIQLSQYLIIWSGNLPEETPWYIRRSVGGWQIVTFLLIVLQFVLPFLVLLSRTVKRGRRPLGTVAAVVFATRAIDLFWLIAPAFHPDGFYLHWLDITAFVGIGGVWLAAYAWWLKRQPLLPSYDIRVIEEETEHGGRREKAARSY